MDTLVKKMLKSRWICYLIHIIDSMVTQGTQVEDADMKLQHSMHSKSKNEHSFNQNTTSRSHISKQHHEETLKTKSITVKEEMTRADMHLKIQNIASPSTLSPR